MVHKSEYYTKNLKIRSNIPAFGAQVSPNGFGQDKFGKFVEAQALLYVYTVQVIKVLKPGS